MLAGRRAECTRTRVGPARGRVRWWRDGGDLSVSGDPAPWTARDRGVHMGLGFPRGATPEPVDKLQISGALMAPSDGPSPVELADAGQAPHGLGVLRDQYVRKVRKNPTIRMVPGSMRVEGRLVAVRRLGQRRRPRARRAGDPADLGRQHPRLLRRRRHVLAGERASGRATRVGGSSTPACPDSAEATSLDWHDVSMEILANQVTAVVHQVGAGPAVVLGHSMGGAVAVQFAHDHPRRSLGRDLSGRREHAGVEGSATASSPR